MAIRNIVKFGDDVLRKKCREVTAFDGKLHQLLDDMAETMHSANGVGLAAPQVGMLKRAFVIDVGDGVVEMINPKIVATAGKQVDAEGCLSYPDEYAEVERPRVVIVRYQDRNGEAHELRTEDLMARAVCHESDHLDGILFIDRATGDVEHVRPRRRRR